MGWTTHIAGQQWTAADANYLGNRINETGTLAARPASGAVTGAEYTATDTLQKFRWNGTAWIVIDEPWTALTGLAVPRIVRGDSSGCVSQPWTSSTCDYKRDNGRIHLRVIGTMGTNAGGAAILLGLSGLPFPTVTASFVSGVFIYGRGGTIYSGALQNYSWGPDASGQISTSNGGYVFFSHALTGALGFTPVVGDTLQAEFFYRVAS